MFARFCLFQSSPTLLRRFVHIIDSKVACEMLTKLFVGYAKNRVYKSWKYDQKHRAECKTHNVFRATWPEGDNEGGPLPWRLTRDERNVLDQRMSCVKWPHYVEQLYYDELRFGSNQDGFGKFIGRYYDMMHGGSSV